MNKRYMDFVPSKGAPVSRQQIVATKKKAAKVATAPRRVKSMSRKVVRTSGSVGFDARANQGVELGVIEDFAPKFIKTATEKRPLNSGKQAPKVVPKKAVVRGSKVNSRSTTKVGTAKVSRNTAGNYTTSPFINMDKVEKRPLSGAASRAGVGTGVAAGAAAVAVPKKKAAKKRAIAAKKESKDSRLGLIVTIILTVILGAVAGTVAFLLLPK